MAAVRVPARTASGRLSPRTHAARKPAQKASPAPVVSRTTAECAGKCSGSAPTVASKTPSGPSFTATTP
jgi:hypothetical protein